MFNVYHSAHLGRFRGPWHSTCSRHVFVVFSWKSRHFDNVIMPSSAVIYMIFSDLGCVPPYGNIQIFQKYVTEKIQPWKRRFGARNTLNFFVLSTNSNNVTRYCITYIKSVSLLIRISFACVSYLLSRLSLLGGCTIPIINSQLLANNSHHQLVNNLTIVHTS